MQTLFSRFPTILRQPEGGDTGGDAGGDAADESGGGGGHYNPDQPRDWHGRWTAGPAGEGGGSSAEAPPDNTIGYSYSATSGKVNLLETPMADQGPPTADSWQAGNMAAAVLGRSDFSGVTQHYLTQAQTDPAGTKAEIQAVTMAMAKADAARADAFYQHMSRALPQLFGATSSGSFDPVMGDARTPPAWKADAFKSQPGAWEGFNTAVNRLPGVGAAERFAYGQIYAAEGGNIKDPISSASSGILQSTLDSARSRVPGLGRVRTPSDLNADQRAALYRDYFDQTLAWVGGSDALNKLGDPLSAAALADTLFRHGGGGGTRLLQSAINQVNGNTALAADGGMGAATFDDLTKLTSNPETRDKLLNRLAILRDRKTNGKEADRMNHYRPRR